jgi:hypothetical protein
LRRAVILKILIAEYCYVELFLRNRVLAVGAFLILAHGCLHLFWVSMDTMLRDAVMNVNGVP